MLRIYTSMAALTAFAALAADTGAGSSSNPALSGDPTGANPTAGADPAADKPEDKKADDKKPEPPTPARTPKRVHIVWAAAGHPTFAPGALLSATEEQAEALRAAGRARRASAEEVKAQPKGTEIPEFG